MLPINITGPMFSGKTSQLITMIDRERHGLNKCLILRLEGDNRYGKKDNILTTHSEINYDKVEIKVVKVLDDALFLYIMTGEYKVVGIEEGQFYNNVDKFVEVLSFYGIKVIITSLNSDYLQRPFPVISRLNARATVIQLKAVCLDCRDDNGVFTVRTNNSEEVILIGGKDLYRPVCKKCVYKYNSPGDIIYRSYGELKKLCRLYGEENMPECSDYHDVIKQLTKITNIVNHILSHYNADVLHDSYNTIIYAKKLI